MTENEQPLGEPVDAYSEQTSNVGSSESVFDELIGTSNTPGFEEGNVESVNPESNPNVAQPLANENNDSQKYWQSEADKRAHERDEIYRALGVNNVEEARQMTAEMRDVMPIAKYIKGNKEVLDVVDKSLRGEPLQGQVETEPKETSVQKPVKPVRPQGYDDMDAYQDAESESFKYRVAQEQYRDKMIDYTQTENESLKNNIQQAQMQQQRNVQVQQLKQHLVQSRGYTEQQANDFVTWADQDQSFTMNNLIDLHGKVRGIQQVPQTQPQQQGQFVEPQVERKVQEMIQQRERLSQPGSVANAGGYDNSSQRPVEESMMNEMVASDKKSNPWT